MSKFYKIGFFILLFLIVVGATFYLGVNFNKYKKEQAEKLSPTLTVDEEVEVDSPKEETVEINDLDDVKENIEAGIKTANYQAIGSYMTEQVSVILYASECCEPQNRDAAINQMGYVKSGENWNFDQSNDVVVQLKTKQYFGPDSFIGVASNEYAIAFMFDEQNRIKGFSMTPSYKLVLDN